MDKIFIKNPYLYTIEDYSTEIIDINSDLTDSSGYLSLSDQISIITNQSEINNEFRRGMVDNFNESKFKLIEQLASFEEDDYVNEQLLKARNGDALDRDIILQNAYDAGYATGFFQHRSDSEEVATSKLGDVAEKVEPENKE